MNILNSSYFSCICHWWMNNNRLHHWSKKCYSCCHNVTDIPLIFEMLLLLQLILLFYKDPLNSCILHVFKGISEMLLLLRVFSGWNWTNNSSIWSAYVSEMVDKLYCYSSFIYSKWSWDNKVTARITNTAISLRCYRSRCG